MPRASGSSRAFEPLRAFLAARIEERLVPGAVFAAGRAAGPAHIEAVGHRTLFPRPEPLTEGTIFDLASLTKPMVTAPLLVGLARRGVVGLDDPVGRHLEETRGTRVGSLTLRSLLAHTSGLPAMNPLEDYIGGKPRLYTAIAREPLAAEPGERLIYSDVGYMLA